MVKSLMLWLCKLWKHGNIQLLVSQFCSDGLVDPLYNVYCKTTTAKEFGSHWNASTSQKMLVTKKFVVISGFWITRWLIKEAVAQSRFRPAVTQAGKNLKKLLKHKLKEMSVEGLGCCLRIERGQQAGSERTLYTPEYAKG
ncbi:hypothetical protein Tco_0975824 [Tanacetum coccineum]|uniref:Uncharacterized protein n=1 Tax=Tanacetum coccineum TaxID=301880 RepID=A0ABQ5EFS8_9ASTR